MVEKPTRQQKDWQPRRSLKLIDGFCTLAYYRKIRVESGKELNGFFWANRAKKYNQIEHVYIRVVEKCFFVKFEYTYSTDT